MKERNLTCRLYVRAQSIACFVASLLEPGRSRACNANGQRLNFKYLLRFVTSLLLPIVTLWPRLYGKMADGDFDGKVSRC